MLAPLPFVWPLTGGLLVGLSAALYLLLNGRVAGVSGLTAAATGLSRGAPRTLGLGFIAGLLGGAALAAAFVRRPELQVTSDIGLLILGGLIVGFGTRWGSGCTSGHGVCGLARLSPRSIVATGVFMAVAALTVFITRHVMGGLA
ncbi:MAG: hypothetical protein B7Z42_08355 [Brevundimonas sp. 12-68-7]|uniref:Uncharacterized protein n=1 Tax=Brevundimonas subvibrioides TaxID=74313 RepID=A0A258FJ45_9CAUL|nr:MAG: hypothetical protein B7Z42_08355 [Brevundimonas sp. 12-68-7]OYX32610.1 MAG: hypothetical protein B7Z01_10620 [Brevundimonas subvibrioides]